MLAAGGGVGLVSAGYGLIMVPAGNGLLNALDPLGKERGKLGVRQQPAGGFNRTGGVRGACCRISHWRSTGSPSKAMDWAT